MLPVTRSIWSRLTADENRLRSALLKCLVDTGAPVAFAEVGAALSWPPEQTAAAAAGIINNKMVVLDADARVQFAYPVSTAATSHKVALADGRTLYAMCAIDALGCCFTFDQPVTVESACQICGKPLRVQVNGVDDIVAHPPDAYVVHVDLDKYEDWATKT
jgi:hypothetical protein